MSDARDNSGNDAVVDAWNEAHPIGTTVRVWPGLREGRGIETVTRSRAAVLGGHTPVVWVEGREDTWRCDVSASPESPYQTTDLERETLECVVMPCCGFAFAAVHSDATDDDGASYSCPLCNDEPAFDRGYAAGKFDRDQEWQRYFDTQASEHQKLAEQRHAEAMEAYREGDKRTYGFRMDSGKTHKALSDTYHRVSRRIESGKANYGE